MWLTFKIVFEITFLHFLKRNDNNNTTFAIYSPDGNYFTVAIPQRDVGGLTRLCPDFTDRSVWCLSAVWILSGFLWQRLSDVFLSCFCLSRISPLSGFCPEFLKKLCPLSVCPTGQGRRTPYWPYTFAYRPLSIFWIWNMTVHFWIKINAEVIRSTLRSILCNW